MSKIHRCGAIPPVSLPSLSRMITAIAGPYGPNYSQGRVGGVLEEKGYTSSQVYKL